MIKRLNMEFESLNQILYLKFLRIYRETGDNDAIFND